MKFLNLFTHEHIHDVLKKTFSYSNESEISFSANKSSSNENFTILNVKGKGIEQKYVLVKIPKILGVPEKQLNNSTVACPVFIIKNKNNEYYGAFESQHGIENFTSPVQNSTECLQIILQDLAEHQAQSLANSEIETPSEYNVKDIADIVTSLDFFKDLDKTVIRQSVELLQLAAKEIFNGSNLLIRSIWCPFANNVYVNQNKNKSIFLNISAPTIVPPAYDALLYIFSFSDEKFRQKNFEDLMLYYFESLTESFKKLQSKLADKITRVYGEYQVKVLLPFVKFQIGSYFLKLENSQRLQETLTNILNFLKYPIINQEDIYETVNNKIGSSNYDLLNYSLVGLNETNGHLGEYFHLQIKIKMKDEEQELQLFAKFLNVSVDLMKDIVESGPAKKEDFFYKTLIPFYSKHGLDILLDFAPKCYLSKANRILVLDDLSLQGYVGLKPNAVLDYEGLRTSIKNLAKFHACTIIIEEILSEENGKIVRLDEIYGEFLEETIFLYEDDNPMKPFFDASLDAICYIVEKFPEITKKLNTSPEELRALVKKTFFSILIKVKKSDTIRNAISHGDMYVANMLFRFTKDKVVTEQIFVDFQLLRYTTPNYDLLFFLFENSTKETRDKYQKVLIEEYYQYMSENIKKFNFDPQIVFPKNVFDENINFMMSAGIIGALMYAHVVHIDPDFREEIFHDQEKFNYYFATNKTELVDLSWDSEHYRNILKGLVEDLVDVIKSEV